MTTPNHKIRLVMELRRSGVTDTRVLSAIERTPREAFCPPQFLDRAYEDTALPIGHGQTISQPYIVARTAELALANCADPKSAKVLEIGTGCGYAAAVLARLFGSVISVERVRALHELARSNLRPLRVSNLRLVFGDGTLGVPSEAPFDAIVAAAAGEVLPAAWIEQLKPGGRIVAPLGGDAQKMTVVAKDAAGRISRRTTEAVRFVPLKGGTA